ncbi:MAG: ABC transporter ATP-binding protein [Chloroflexi bacterium]|nr:ABC transporter ATP-binding protein [Chloroflexota bacterium]
MLEVEDLEVSYGDLRALWGISLRVDEGEIVALVGANGAGKTTALRTISGLQGLRSGSIRFAGKPIGDLPAHEIVRLGLVQVAEGRKIFPQMSVYENLLMGAYVPEAKRLRDSTMEDVFTLFPRLKERRTQLAGTLSGGEQQMVAIGRALMTRPKLLMLDEPSLGLAPLVVEEVLRVVGEINRRGIPVLLVEQNVHEALVLAHRGYVLENGRVALSGPSTSLRDDERIRKAYLGL